MYALPISLEQKSLKTEVPLLLSIEIDILENRRRRMNNALFPLLQLLNNSPTSLDKIDLTLFKCTQTLQTEVLMSKENSLFGEIYFKAQKT